MYILKSSKPKPNFVSKVVQKERPKTMAITIPGQGDPLITFDNKSKKILTYLQQRNTKPTGPTFGVYYTDRRDVGVKNVKWDACVPVKAKLDILREMIIKEFPNRQVISTTLTGSYDLIGPTIEYIDIVAKENDVIIKWPLTEIYLKEGQQPVTELQFLTNK